MPDRMITHYVGDDCPGGHRDLLAEPRTTPVTLRRREMPEDRWGCNRDCIEEHTYQWGSCAAAPPPPPRLGLLVSDTFTDLDGCVSVRLREATVGEAKRCIAEFEGPPTIRDLVRAARAAGAPLRRHYSEHGMTEYWQCWDEGARRRRAKVRHWPQYGTWRVEIYGRYDNPVGDNAVDVDLLNPSIDQIAAAAELCGWEVPRGAGS